MSLITGLAPLIKVGNSLRFESMYQIQSELVRTSQN